MVNTVAGLLRPDHGRIVIGQDVLLDSQAGIEMPSLTVQQYVLPNDDPPMNGVLVMSFRKADCFPI